MRDLRSNSVSIPRAPYDFSKIRVGKKTLIDAALELRSLNKVTSNNLAKRETVLKALSTNNIPQLIQISQFFFETSGIYNRLCKYLAYLYNYDWYLCPYTPDSLEPKREEKILKELNVALDYLENSNIKLNLGDIALSVVKNGSYYGYLIEEQTRFSIQELPAKYCRSRFCVGDTPVIEFNMKFFDDSFTDVSQRERILKLFPEEFKKGYTLYKSGKLTPDFQGDENSWYMLEPGLAFKFNLNNSDYPVLVGAIPAIIDLDEAQELDKKKTLQELLKIMIQKVPLDKNNELIFDMEEIMDIHNNAVEMVSPNAVGVDVLTTFTDVRIEDLADKNSTTSKDDLEKVERNLFNQTGISANLFNADGNISLEKSVLNDVAAMYNLVLQFQNFLNFVIDRNFNKNRKKHYFKLTILNTTIYNYQELYSKYKELVQIGYSKILPMIALGHSQSSIIASLIFENKTLKLSELMIPPRSSNTMSGKIESSNSGGRPEKKDSEKSDKTILNREAMGKE